MKTQGLLGCERRCRGGIWAEPSDSTFLSFLSIYLSVPKRVIKSPATAEDAETVPAELRCIWPGCTRRRAPGRAAGSGRQREYCLKADRPEAGGGPVHNARNRWAWRRTASGGDAGDAGTGTGIGGGTRTGGSAPGDGRNATAGAAAVDDGEAPPSVMDIWPVSS